MVLRRAVVLLLALGPGAAGALHAQAGGQAEARRASEARVSTRGWFGFTFEAEHASLAGIREPETVRISSVVSESPAYRGGLREGDVVVSVAGLAATARWMERAARGVAPGDTLRLRVRRGADERDLTLVAAARPDRIHVVHGLSGGRIFLADSLRLRAQVVLDSIRADVRDVRFFMLGDSLGAPAQVVIRDAAGDERRLRVGREGAEVLLRDLRAAIARQQASAPVRIEIDAAAAENLRDAIVDIQRIRHEGLRDAPGLFVLRDSARLWVEAPTARGYGVSMAAWSMGVAGAEFTPLAPEMRPYFGVDEGLLVIDVGRGTPAAKAGLAEGDVVVEVGGRRTRTVRELAAALARAGDDGLTLQIVRRRERRTIRIPGP